LLIVDIDFNQPLIVIPWVVVQELDCITYGSLLIVDIDFNQPLIVIPWVVVQELDCIKDGKQRSSMNEVC